MEKKVKACKVHGEMPIGNFKKISSGKYSYWQCIICKSAYNRAYYRKNREEIRGKRNAYQMDYYRKNKEAILKKNAEYRKDNPHLLRAYMREYMAKRRAANKGNLRERISEYNKNYYDKNREKIIQYHRDRRKREKKNGK